MEKLNLYQKLVEIRKSVEYLKKEATGHRYSYTKESQIISALRPKMDELGIVLEFDMIEPTWHESGSSLLVNVGFRFTFVNAENPEEKISKNIYLQDVAGDPKKTGGLMTYANRYFLSKFFQIATDEMDIDQYQDTVMNSKKTADPYISKEQVKEIDDLINGFDDIRARINARYKSIDNIRENQYKIVIATIKKLIESKEE